METEPNVLSFALLAGGLAVIPPLEARFGPVAPRRSLRPNLALVPFVMATAGVVGILLASEFKSGFANRGMMLHFDALVIAVSEERGTISFCFNGNIVPNLDGASLKQALLGLFGQRARAKKKV